MFYYVRKILYTLLQRITHKVHAYINVMYKLHDTQVLADKYSECVVLTTPLWCVLFLARADGDEDGMAAERLHV